MKKLYLSFLTAILCLGMNAHAQSSTYYWSDGNKVNLTQDRSSAVIYFNENAMPARMEAPANASVKLFEHHSRALIQFESAQPQNLRQLTDQLGISAADLRSVSFGWKLEDGFPLWLTHEVVIQPKNKSDLESLRNIVVEYGGQYLRQDFQTHVLDVANIDNVIPLANALQESGLVEWAIPNIYAEATLYADPYYSQQFQMNNTGQTIDGFAGTNDMDCNAPEAWAITLGSSSITVAVIDDGVEAHEDLVTGTGASRVLSGYTPANGGNGAPIASSAHGESCAGIIAASHNNLGVQGVAPNVYLRTVNIFAGGETTQDIANGITWAKNNGADVMSNSWGYTSCTFTASNITSAISDAVTNGRSGKGCVVVFASGNGYKTCVDYPANLSTVITVGAFGNDGIKSDYSNSGSQMDLCAPSNDVNASGFLSGAGVRTTDRMGSNGYNSGNYNTGFGGTSAATPVVSGVAALVLSVDPNLTDAQVKNILYTTANDMGTSGFDNLYGNGRVNAYGAVVAAGGSSGGGGCTSTVSSFPYSESFESGEGWTQGSGDNMDWTRRSGGTPSSGTGPASAAAGTYYMYTEASSPNYPSKNAYFESPCFDVSGLSNPEFSFQYNMNGATIGTLRLQASTNGSTWTTLWSLSGNQGTAWATQTVSLSSYSSETELRLRFFATTGTNYTGDIAIDDLSLTGGSGGGGCSLNEMTLTLVLDNYPTETSWELRNSGGGLEASGGGYSVANSTVVETFCLGDGCYDFTIFDSFGDGICCAYGNGSWDLSDASGSLASGGSFTSTQTANVCLGGSGGGCPTIDFNSYTITAYGNGQDLGTYAIQDAGATLFIQNNAWKDIALNYTVTANTVVEFDFRSTIEGEIHGLGFDTDEGISNNLTFQVHGTQAWGILNYNNYSGTAWTTYTIPVGSFYTGTFTKLFFVADHDASPSNGNSYFRNIKIYEGSCPSSLAPAYGLGTPMESQLGTQAEFDLELWPSPASAELFVRTEGWNGPQQATISDLSGKVMWTGHVSAQQTRIDVGHLPAGMFLFQAQNATGETLTKKFLKVK
ncbi:MAG: S8 family serine peptidase [Bacteroidia bacterium]|nr:S8 family serine peptidase [Bacteroidia bacterium]